MAAVKLFGNAAGAAKGGSKLTNFLKLAIIVFLVGGSIWLLLAHSEWFRDPKMVKVEVLQYGAWGPVIFMLLYAVGPCFE